MADREELLAALNSEKRNFLIWRQCLRYWPQVVLDAKDYLADDDLSRPCLQIARTLLCLGVYANDEPIPEFEALVTGAARQINFKTDKEIPYSLASAEATFQFPVLSGFPFEDQDVGNILYFLQFYADFRRDELLRDELADISAENSSPLFSPPLSENTRSKLLRAFTALETFPSWDFWRRWYQGFQDGRPLPWELQKEIALIPEDAWQAGTEAVAEEIEKIEARHDLLSRIEDFERGSEAQANRMGIGGNNPPVEIDDPTITREIAIIWDVVHDLKEETQKETPSKSRIETLIGLLSAGLKSVLHLCGRLAEHGLKVGVTLAVTAGGAKFFKPELLEAIVEAAKRFLSSGAAG